MRHPVGQLAASGRIPIQACWPPSRPPG